MTLFLFFFDRIIQLTVLFVGVVNRYLIIQLSLSWLWDRGRTCEVQQICQGYYPNRVYFYALARTPLIVRAWQLWYGAVGLNLLVGLAVTNTHVWFPYMCVMATCYALLWFTSYSLVFGGVKQWTVYLLVYHVLLAVALVQLADLSFTLLETDVVHVTSLVMDGLNAFVLWIWSFMLCYRDSFKDMPMEAVGNPDRVRNAAQIVLSQSFEVRVLLQTLGQTVYHNGKFPKSKKTVGFEYGLLSNAFPHVCEGISAEHQVTRHGTYMNQAGLIGALGSFFVVYCLFVLGVMECQVVGKRGSKHAPSSSSCYARVDNLFNIRNRASAVSSSFQLTGTGYQEYKAQKDQDKTKQLSAETPSSTARAAGPKKSPGRGRGVSTTSPEASFLLILFFSHIW